MTENTTDDYGDSGMSKSKFNLAFYGPGIHEGGIDVRDYAPSLLALADLVQTANEIENEGRVRAQVRVCATREGCFDVEVEVVQTLVDAMLDIARAAKGEPVATPAAVILTLLFGSGGLFALYKRLRGSPPTSVQKHGNSVTITSKDGTTTNVTQNTFNIYESPAAAEHAKKFTDVLKKGGTERVVARLPSKDECDIAYDDSSTVDASMAAQLTVTAAAGHERTLWLDIITAGLERGAKWRVSDGGGSEFVVTITDEVFLDDVDNNQERFGHGDRLYCVLREEQDVTSKGNLRTTRSIPKVLRHTEPEQRDLFR